MNTILKESMMLLFAGVALTTSAAHAEFEPYFFDSSGYDVGFIYSDWTTNSGFNEPLTTKEEFAGTLWDTYAFLKMGENDRPSTGFQTFEINATITSRNKLDAVYRRAAILLSYMSTSYRDLPHNVSLRISPDQDFENNYQECALTYMISAVGDYFIFDIPQTESPQYYKFIFNVPEGGPSDGWVMATEFLFYLSADYLTATYDADEKTCTLVSKRGELHVQAKEYDSNGQPLNTLNSVIVKEEGWTNQVAAQDEPYVIHAPETHGNYIDITAKSVFNGEHSAEKRFKLTQEGIVSGTEILMNAPDNETLPVEWYDISGRKLKEPQSGFMIRKQGSDVKRILVR